MKDFGPGPIDYLHATQTIISADFFLESSGMVRTLFPSWLDVLKELEAENYTMRITAKRSFWKYRLECPNPLKKMVYEWFRLRSTEVDRGRLKSQEYLGRLFGRPYGFGSSVFAKIVYVFKPRISICCRGPPSALHHQGTEPGRKS